MYFCIPYASGQVPAYVWDITLRVQIYPKRWFLGCVNSRPAARGTQAAGFTQPRNHLLEHLYIHLDPPAF